MLDRRRARDGGVTCGTRTGRNGADGLLHLFCRGVLHAAGPLADRCADTARGVAGKPAAPPACLWGSPAFLAARGDEPAGFGRPGKLGAVAGLALGPGPPRGGGGASPPPGPPPPRRRGAPPPPPWPRSPQAGPPP